jgi:hypothetical protein
LITRNNHVVANLRHHAGILEAAVQIDDQSRIACQHGRRIEVLDQMIDQFTRTDVISDMLLQRCFIEAEVIQRFWYDVADMISGKQNAGLAPFIDDRVGRRIVGSNY